MSLTLTQNTTFSSTIILGDGGTPVTGLVFGDVTAYVSKNGSAPVAYTLTGSNFNEISAANMPGFYHVDFTATETNTLGEVVITFSGGTFDTYALRAQVIVGSIADLDASLSTIEAKVDTVDGVVDTIQATTASINSSTGALSSGLTAVQTQLTAVQGVGFNTSSDSLVQIRDTFDTRVPSGVALQSLFVNGTGNATPPTDKGIWDVLGDGTTSISDMGLDMKRMLGLAQENYRVTGQTYDANNNLISGVIKLYPTKADVEADTNPFETYVIAATYDGSNRLISYQVTRN
jgi:hypothetical protein